MFFKRSKNRRREPTLIPTLREQFPDAPARHLDTVANVRAFTMTSPERILALCQAVEHINRNQIPGAIVECGVWRGGSMAAAARTLMASSTHSRDLWLYDTFDGMSEPTAVDVDLAGKTAKQLLSEQDRQDPKSVWCRSAIEEVKQVLKQTGYPTNQIHFVAGRVEDTLPEQRPEQVALLRLDTDWYESTRCELEYLFPLLSPGAVLIIDDYGHWAGCRRAVDEYFDKNRVQMLLNRIDYTGRIGVYHPSNQAAEKRHAA